MLIDSFQPGWPLELVRQHAALTAGEELFLLIDSAFVPGLHRQLGAGSKPFLLFGTLPGFTEDTRDVSPFLVRFDPNDQSVARVLERCNAYPMLSAITSNEGIQRLGERLAAWCIVELDGQWFNFRFPDTRRLPAIIDVLTPVQRQAFVGSASSWHYIGRDGTWRSLFLERVSGPVDIVDKAKLDDMQFARLVEDSEADALWTRLQYRGIDWQGLPSRRHRLLSQALDLAREHRLDELQTLRWCSSCLSEQDDTDMQKKFAGWMRRTDDVRDEALPSAV